MNRQRLTILRDALIQHAKKPGNLKFDLQTWATARAYDRENGTEVVCGARLGKNFCGTTACAMGLAASLPEFNRLGLRLNDIRYGTAEVIYENGKRDSFNCAPEGFDAAEQFFGISDEDAMELFSSMNYRRADRKNPVAVADKITALLNVK